MARFMFFLLAAIFITLGIFVVVSDPGSVGAWVLGAIFETIAFIAILITEELRD